MLIQSIIDIPQICYKRGIYHVVLSPGSRNAHITIAFARHPQIEAFVIPDERAAAYIALGMAQSLDEPVALVCTSGTAVLNYYPAIAEAYYQNIPLLVLTADRPAFWIDKNDGQTIRQTNVYVNHIKNSYTFPETFEKKEDIDSAQLLINEAINLAREYPCGPVHINIPIKEPFYPEKEEKLDFSKNVIVKEKVDPKNICSKIDPSVISQIKGKRLAIVAGQQHRNEQLISILNKLTAEKNIPVFTDTISNMQTVKGAITMHDSFDFKGNHELIPECIISFGRSIISKKLKLALRNNKNLEHIHICDNDYPADTYLSLTQVIHSTAVNFFRALSHVDLDSDRFYYNKLVEANEEAKGKVGKFLNNVDFGEFVALQKVVEHIPAGSVVHLANSMTVRYYNMLGTTNDLLVFSNRGTSGIDGCTSTAVGHAIQNKTANNILLTGDMAFFYDRNALWHHHIPSNLKIVIFNNHGGGIFRLIDGPNRQPELVEYFETRQSLTAKNTAEDFGLEYFHCKSEKQLNKAIDVFFKADKAALLEIETNKEINQMVFEKYKKAIS